MVLSAKVVTYTANTTTGNQALTGSGFTPKAAIVWWSRATNTVDTFEEHATMGFGFTDGINQYCLSGVSEDNQATSDASRGIFDSALIMTSNISGTTSTTDAEADIVSLDSDGMTITWVDAPAAAFKFHVLYLGGSDITNVKAEEFIGANATGNQDITNTGFQPDFIITMSANTNFPNTTFTSGGWSFTIGAVDADGNQWSQAIASETGRATMDTWQYYSHSKMATYLSQSAGSLLDSFSFVSMLSNGFRINNDDTTVIHYAYLALKGGNYKVGNATEPAATGIQTVTTNKDCQAVMIFGLDTGTADSSQTHNMMTVGGGTSSTNRATVVEHDTDGVGASVCVSRYETDSIYLNITANATAGSSTIDDEADLDSVIGSGFTLDWVNIGQARPFRYITFGTLLTSVTKTLTLLHDIKQEITKSLTLRQDVIQQITDTNTIRFDVNTSITKQLSLIFDVISQTTKSLTLLNNIIQEITKSLTLRHDILTPVTKQLSLIFSVLQEVTKSLTIIFNEIGQITKSLTLRFDEIGQTTKQLTLRFDELTEVTKQLTIRHDVIAQTTKILTLRQDIQSQVTKSLTLRQDILTSVTKSLNLLYNLQSEVTKSLTLLSNIISQTTKSTSLRFDVNEIVSRTLTIRQDIRNEITKQQTLRWNVDQAITKLLNLQFSVNQAITKQLTLRNDILSSTTRTLTIRNDILMEAMRNLTLRQDIIAQTTKLLTLRFEGAGAVTKSLTIRFDIISQTTKALTLMFTTLQETTKNLNLLFSLIAQTTKTITLRNNIEQEVTRTLTLIQNIIAQTVKTTTLRYNVLQEASKSLTLRQDIKQETTRTLTLRQNISQIAQKDLTLLYQILQEVPVVSRTLRYNIEQQITKQLTLLSNIQQQTTKQLNVKFDIKTQFVKSMAEKLLDALKARYTLLIPPSSQLLWHEWYNGQNDITITCIPMTIIPIERQSTMIYKKRHYVCSIHLFYRHSVDQSNENTPLQVANITKHITNLIFANRYNPNFLNSIDAKAIEVRIRSAAFIPDDPRDSTPTIRVLHYRWLVEVVYHKIV